MITVLGWYGQDNVGDESYKLAFGKIFPAETFNFVNKITDFNQPTYILGGGNVCSKPFTRQILATKGKKIAMSVSITDADDLKALAEFDEIYVRDQTSVEKLNKLDIKAEYLPDNAFILEPDPEKGKELIDKLLDQRKIENYDKKVAIVLNAHLLGRDNWLARDYTDFEHIVWKLANIMDTTPANFILVPFCTNATWDDRITNGWLSARCKWKGKHLLLWEPLTPQDMLNLISAVDVVVSTRLHASIFSVIANKPFIDLTHHDKNLQFLKTIYKEEWSVSYWHFDETRFRTLLNDFLDKDWTADLSKISNLNRTVLSGVYKHVRML